MDNAEFIDGLRRHDPVAARHLNECFVPSVWRFVYARVDRDTHLAEDIVAESVLALVAAAASETKIDHPAAWMRTVALRRIQDHFRAAARVQHLIEQAQPQTKCIDEQDPAAKHDQKLKRQNVRQAMDDLPETYRLVLEWKYVDQASVKLIAKRLGATEKSAESVLYRARQALRNQLNKHHVEPPQSATATMQQHAGGSPAKSESANPIKQSNGESESSLQKGRPPVFQPRLARES